MLIVPLAVAGYWSARLAYADLLYGGDTLDQVRAAVRLDPGNARYLAWLADLTEHEGDDPRPALGRAATLNPRDSAIRIRLGLLAEQRGDFGAAEGELEEAARIDHQFDPRSALAQYYFRRGDAPRFWHWMREALAVGYGNLAPLFDLAWRMTDRPEVVRAALPADHAVEAQYLSYLLSTDRLEAAAVIARSVAVQAATHFGTSDRDLLLAACDRTFDIATWNALCDRLIPCRPLDPDRGISLTNPAFAYAPVLHGFDWRIPANPEVSVTRGDAPPSLRITLSGREAESCELLYQYVPLAPDRRYRFRFQVTPAEPGLFWRIFDRENPVARSEFEFESGSIGRGRLALVYRRPAGSARLEGSIMLRDLELRFAE